MPVFFVSPQCIAPPTITITDDLLTHLRDSLRVSIGESLWFGNGLGTKYRAEITDISKGMLTGRILDTIQEPPRHLPRLFLGQSLLKGEKMDWVIQKATELGVDKLMPIESRHSVVQLKADRVDHQLARWQRIALEAAQQSEQWRTTTITSPHSLTSLLRSHVTDTVTLMLTERQDGRNLQTVELPHDATGSVLVLIGPEGGWSKEELHAAEQGDIRPITLGQHILRAETAAIAAISILQSRLGRLG